MSSLVGEGAGRAALKLVATVKQKFSWAHKKMRRRKRKKKERKKEERKRRKGRKKRKLHPNLNLADSVIKCLEKVCNFSLFCAASYFACQLQPANLT